MQTSDLAIGTKSKKNLSLQLTAMIGESMKNRVEGYQEIPRCLLMPDNSYVALWDMFMIVVLLFSCIETPIQIAFEKGEISIGW